MPDTKSAANLWISGSISVSADPNTEVYLKCDFCNDTEANEVTHLGRTLDTNKGAYVCVSSLITAKLSPK
jgi:hypothetical protein